jgi:ERCC4-type nuclease
MTIILKIDNRELKIKELFHCAGSRDIALDIKYENLDYGDFIFEVDDIPLLVIERKNIFDLICSIKDTRYVNQKINLLKNFERNKIYYIIEGEFDYNKDNEYNNNRLSKKTIISSIVNMMIRDDIKVFQTKNELDTFNLITNIAEKLIKDINKYISNDVKSLQIKKISNITKENCFIYQLCQIPGLSQKSAKAITDIYPTMEIFFNTLSNKTVDEKNNILSNIIITDSKGKIRKISSKIVLNLINYMF